VTLAAAERALRRPRRAAAAPHGFTIVELLVAMAVIGIVLGPLASMLTTVSWSSNITMNQDALLTEARSAVEVIVTDVREAYTSSSSVPAIVSMNGTQLTFYAPDGLQPFHLMEISYQLTGKNLQRAFATSTNTGGPPWTIPALGGWSTVIGSVSNSTIFTYQDANGNATTDVTKVSRVLVTLTISPSDGGPATTYQDSATIRGTTG
jgi:prepilin-type N-terminal cleavage/methylation domain-containing protein